jgi:hypothetical protein
MGAPDIVIQPPIAFRVREHERPGLEVRVNFGLLTGRDATPAEIDDLARELRRIVRSFEIVAEQRHEFGDDVEVSVHQVVIETAAVPDDVAVDVVGTAERWARACFDMRHADISEL